MVESLLLFETRRAVLLFLSRSLMFLGAASDGRGGAGRRGAITLRRLSAGAIGGFLALGRRSSRVTTI